MALTKIRGNTQVLDLSITNSQIANKDEANPDGILLSKIQDGDLLVKSDGSVAFTSPVSGVTPTQDGQLATKGYVDGVAQGLDVKASVRAVATTNVTMSGTQTIDGVSLNVGDRVLLAGQTNNVQNGIYVVSAGSWTRAPDATTNADVTPGLFTFVEEGSLAQGTGWVLTSTGPTTLGTTPLPFTQFSAAGITNPGAGLTKTGNTLDVVSANGGIVVTADAIALTLADSTLAIDAGGLKLASLAEGNILIGSAGGVATAQAVSGDATLAADGTLTIGTGAVTNAKLAGNISLDKLASGTAGQVIVANGSGVPTYTSLTGDVTISSSGVTTIANDAVTTVKVQDGAVTLAKLVALDDAKFIVGTGAGNAQVAITGDVTVSNAGVATVDSSVVVKVADVITRETPTGAVDGTNPTFVLANTPKTGTEHVYLNGLLMDEGSGNDYSIAGDTITFTFNPQTGDKIRVSYFK